MGNQKYYELTVIWEAFLLEAPKRYRAVPRWKRLYQVEKRGKETGAGDSRARKMVQ